MFLEPLESRTLLSSNSLEPTLDFQLTTPPSILLPGPLSRDLIFDPTRNQLLSIQDDTVARYDASSGALLGLISVDHGLERGDITPDGRFLYVTDINHPRIVKIDLDANTYIAIPRPSPISTGDFYTIRDLGVSSGKVFTSQESYNSLGLPCCNNIRQIDLATDIFSNSSFTNYGALTLSKFALIARSADYSYTALISPEHDYSIINNTLSGLPNRHYGNINSIAVSHDGALHAIANNSSVEIINSHFDNVHGFGFANATVAFDPHRDILYVTNGTIGQLLAYDTNSWAELFSIPIGENIFYPSNLAVSDDGQSLFLSTYSGIRVFHPNQNVQLFHEPITLTATLALTPVGTPTGLISFIDTNTGTSLGEAPIQDGIATLELDDLEPGNYSVLARYGGDDSFSAADSGPLTFRIQPALTTATIESPGPNQITVTLHSPAGTPSTGSITLYDSNTLVSTCILDGSSPCSFGLSLPPGVHSLQAVYSGDSEHLATVSGPLRHMIRFPTTLTLSAPDEPTGPGETFTMTIKLSPPLDSSMHGVKIYQDDQLVAGAGFEGNSGVARISFDQLLPGLHRFFAVFDGTELLAPSVSNEVLHDVIARAVTVSLTAPPKATQVNTRLTFKVQATTGTVIPRGQVVFKEGGNILSSGEIASDGGAIYSASNLSVGFHTVTATYFSSNGFATATTDPLTIEVLPNSTRITLTTSTNWFLAKHPIEFSVAFTEDPLTGKVIFKDGNRTIGGSWLDYGTANFSWLPGAGVHNITAYYKGNASFSPATSAPLKITVVPVTTIDLMVLYTPAATRSIGSASAIRQLITNSVADTNLAFLNSHIPVTLRLVRSQQIAYRESGKFHTDLRRLLIPNDGYMDSAHSLRNTYGADLVSLFESDGDLGGVSYELTDLRDKTNADFAFSVVWAPQADAPYFFLAHELGHNLGATHDAQHADDEGATSFSRGWRFRGNDGRLYHDIMSYDPGKTIPYFSNPRIKYQGVATGNAKTADSARTITLTAPYVAGYRRRRV